MTAELNSNLKSKTLQEQLTACREGEGLRDGEGGEAAGRLGDGSGVGEFIRGVRSVVSVSPAACFQAILQTVLY